MVNALIASLALFGASASALSVGTAHVINQCSYDVWLCNVPSSGGGYEEADQTLASGESWQQDWTSLSNGNGWSIKLSKTDVLDNILQYEYTFHEDGTIWYDLSCVNGNPWDGNWEITSSTDTCNPKQQAYRYATDDAYGMQSCPQDASITVTLCSGEDAGNSTSPVSSSSSSASAPTYESTTASAPSYESTTSIVSSSAAPVTTEASSVSTEASSSASSSATSEASPYSAPSPTAYWYDWNHADMSSSLAVADSTPTTFATKTTAVTDANGVTVTEVETAVVTAVVTAYGKRHEHHPHGHRRHA